MSSSNICNRLENSALSSSGSKSCKKSERIFASPHSSSDRSTSSGADRAQKQREKTELIRRVNTSTIALRCESEYLAFAFTFFSRAPFDSVKSLFLILSYIYSENRPFFSHLARSRQYPSLV